MNWQKIDVLCGNLYVHGKQDLIQSLWVGEVWSLHLLLANYNLLLQMELTEIIGIGSGIFTAASMVPQLVKTIREKNADTLSYGMLCVLIIGQIGWIVYGVMKDDLPIMLTNGFSLLVNIALLVCAIRYKERK